MYRLKKLWILLLALLVLAGCSAAQATEALETAAALLTDSAEDTAVSTADTVDEAEPAEDAEAAEAAGEAKEDAETAEEAENAEEETEPADTGTEKTLLSGAADTLEKALSLVQADPEPLVVSMAVPESVTVTADDPTVCLTIAFTVTGEDGPETGRLQVYQDGELVRDLEIQLISYNGDVNLTWEFTRYMTQTEGTVEYVLTYGDETITAQTAVTLENWPDEIYAQLSGAALPYYIEVVKNHNVVLIYGQDEDGNYTQLVKTFVCSTGASTPLGNFTATTRYEWRTLFANSAGTAYCYGQYAIRITGNYLFHSVPYYTQNKGDLEYEEYNKLGTQASLGCIRLAVADVKWIYDNCPSGTPVSIVEREELGVEKPESIYIDPESPYRGWDPTDPDPANPWLTVTDSTEETDIADDAASDTAAAATQAADST